ncbi:MULTISPECIES: hypothetical protein [Actinomadura]|uniref:Uncharacterized protein n=1 Tax=Actinomadura yumaensis TaxID=111807 RepID=A0ABW2CL86_9ACTN|nr:hypothetical protein [Actinomadura sp. J1-007]
MKELSACAVFAGVQSGLLAGSDACGAADVRNADTVAALIIFEKT